MEHSFDAVVVHKNGIITLANQAAVSLAGALSPSELIGKNILEFIHPDFRDLVRERIAAMTSRVEMTAVDIAEEKFLRVDGKAIDVEVVATGFLDAGTPAVQIVFRDISRRRELMETLRMSEEKYRILVEHSQSGVFIIQGREIRYVNSAFARILGGIPDDFIMHDFGEFIALEDQDWVPSGAFPGSVARPCRNTMSAGYSDATARPGFLFPLMPGSSGTRETWQAWGLYGISRSKNIPQMHSGRAGRCSGLYSTVPSISPV